MVRSVGTISGFIAAVGATGVTGALVVRSRKAAADTLVGGVKRAGAALLRADSVMSSRSARLHETSQGVLREVGRKVPPGRDVWAMALVPKSPAQPWRYRLRRRATLEADVARTRATLISAIESSGMQLTRHGHHRVKLHAGGQVDVYAVETADGTTVELAMHSDGTGWVRVHAKSERNLGPVKDVAADVVGKAVHARSLRSTLLGNVDNKVLCSVQAGDGANPTELEVSHDELRHLSSVGAGRSITMEATRPKGGPNTSGVTGQAGTCGKITRTGQPCRNPPGCRVQHPRPVRT